MKPVVTLTMNPALDMSTSVERVESRHKLRCGPAVFDPGGGEGFDPVPEQLPGNASAVTPWRYARWRGPFRCEEASPEERGADRH